MIWVTREREIRPAGTDVNSGEREDVKKSPVHQRAATERKIFAIRGPESNSRGLGIHF
jgi:hypothetical protein